MKKNEIVILAVKLLGLYFTIQGLASVSMTLGQNGFRGLDNWSLYVGVLVYFISGLILFLKAEAISKHILPSDDSVVTELNISENFQSAALRIVGIYVLVFAIPGLLHLAGNMIQYNLYGAEMPNYLKEKPNYIIPLTSQAIYFLIGVFLALGPGSIIRFLGRFDKTIEKMNT
jgi:hypothetical protein